MWTFHFKHGALAGLTAAALLVPATAQADMLEGGLLGKLFRGDDFTGPSLVDLVVIGFLIFIVLRLVTSRTASNKQPPRTEQPPYTPRDDELPPPSAPRDKPDMYTAAQATWDALKTPSKSPKITPTGPAPTYDVPPANASPDEEFLAGAKMAYGRILAAMAERDLDDLAQFTTPQCLAKLKNSLPVTPAGRLDILLVEVSLVASREEGNHTVNDVEYKALVREPGSTQNSERHDRWRFVQDNATPGAHWLLDSLEG